MTLNPILGPIFAAVAKQLSPVTLRSSSSASSVASSSSAPVEDTSPSTPVLRNASLFSTASEFAQLGTLIEIVQSGTRQVGSIMGRLQALAQQAANGGEGVDTAILNSEFQRLLGQINVTVSVASFGGLKLISGPQPEESAQVASAIPTLPDLSTQGLFGGATLDISTKQNATSTLSSIATGQATVAGANATIEDVLAQLVFALGGVNSAIANNVAASSTLSDTDLGDDTSGDIFSLFRGQPGAAVQAQTANLSTSLLSLLQE